MKGDKLYIISKQWMEQHHLISAAKNIKAEQEVATVND